MSGTGSHVRGEDRQLPRADREHERRLVSGWLRLKSWLPLAEDISHGVHRQGHHRDALLGAAIHPLWTKNCTSTSHVRCRASPAAKSIGVSRRSRTHASRGRPRHAPPAGACSRDKSPSHLTPSWPLARTQSRSRARETSIAVRQQLRRPTVRSTLLAPWRLPGSNRLQLDATSMKFTFTVEFLPAP